MAWYTDEDYETGESYQYWLDSPNDPDYDTQAIYSPEIDAEINAAEEFTSPSITSLSGDAIEQQKAKAAFDSTGFDWKRAVSSIGESGLKAITDRYTKNGNIEWGNVAKDAAAAYMAKQAYDQASKPIAPTGYQGGIPSYTGVREQVTPTQGLRAGQGGQRYFTDMKYATDAGLPAAQAATAAQATALTERNAARPVAPAAPVNQDPASNTFFGRTPSQAMQAPAGLATAPRNTAPAAPVTQQATIPANQRPIFTNNDQIMAWNNANASGPLSPNWVMPDDTDNRPAPTPPPVGAAEGGLMGYAKGGVPTKPQGTYLRGETDGMADQIHATIDGQQPARLAHGEFVVPADVVSHLGNGNSDAGAKQLYKMMDRIRMARTGTKKQGKEINPDKFAPDGLAAYAEGGTIASQVASGITGQESNLSNWVGPYVTNMLGKGQALSEQPYQAYQGPLTAGPSALQTTGFQNAANISTPMGIGQAADTAGGIAGQKQTSSFLAPGTTQSYMNPYMQNVVDVQQKEAQRTADIAATNRQGQQTQAGAFGGSRAAVMDAEAARNLALQQGQIQATGLQSAYDAAAKQFNTEQTTGLAGLNTQIQAAQAQGNLGATQNAAGLANLNAQLTAGGTQQGIEQAGVTADKAAFEAERDNPYKMAQYQQSLLQGLPLNAQSYNITNNPYAAAASAGSGVYNMFNTAAKA